ncbi:N-acetylgalactosamine 6-sulfate sulfatase [Zobellia amurskyensis]|uniref:N-acetylgalactosamine 6-sulfate sulfatase n=2 Tax=Zobellia amurskyensis TaxID=248905 RepID=A0A7X2ZTZ4_9FLAO|nr:N-acetylgalactosamine 6-sulfate sulfatase [Zobellia amurskyensis]
MFFGCSEKTKKTETASVDQERPNIILLMADDQGWGDTGYNGHPYLKTPNLDKMASNGAVFERFYAASAVCSPTRGSVMTGRHPLRYGICHANCGHIKSQEITLGEMVKSVGYTTGHFGKWHLGTLTRDTVEANRGGRPKFDDDYAPPWDHGFDASFVTESKVPTWNPMITPPKSAGDVSGTLEEGKPFNTSYWTGPKQIVTDNLEGDDSRVIMDRAIPFIEEAVKSKKPFLTVIWFHTPHLPVLAGEEDRNLYVNLSEDEQHYYGVISAMDKQVGRLRDKLKALGVTENTVLFYTSDNGPEGKSATGRTQGVTNGLKGRKRSLYEGGIRVPGIMEWEGRIQPGTKVDVPCFTSDYFPTIANILGVDLKKNHRPYDGIDILPIAQGKVEERDKALAFEFQKQAALMNNEYKIYSADKGQHFELYNISNDPQEDNNIAEEEPEVLSSMVTTWNKWKTSQENSAQENDY